MNRRDFIRIGMYEWQGRWQRNFVLTPGLRLFSRLLPQLIAPPILSAMRIVGKKNRSEIELDPVEALRRGRVLDAMLRAASPPIPREWLRSHNGGH
jgi:hypothetical protein